MSDERALSTELTGGSGFTYEDTVVAYYLAALLREEGAALQSGIVKSVAVQQGSFEHPMDDLVVEFDDGAQIRTLGLQVKTSVKISRNDDDFKDIVVKALATHSSPYFKSEQYTCGFVAEYIAVERLKSLRRLIDWAKASPTEQDFERRFHQGGPAGKVERQLRHDLKASINAKLDSDWQFYRHFAAERLDGWKEGGQLRAEIVNRLQEISSDERVNLFEHLCRIARESAATATKWTRASLLCQLVGKTRLKVSSSYRDDIRAITDFSASGIAAISDEVAGIHIPRPRLETGTGEVLSRAKLVNLSGLPGCGKSALLKRIANKAAAAGPILFLKSDLLAGVNWLTFASAIGLRHRSVADLLAEIGATGTPIVFIDGIDRIRPDQRGIIRDILRAIEESPHLSAWRVLATSRDQGLEAYRGWFPASFYKESFIGDVAVGAFTDEEASELADNVPSLRRLLFGPKSVAEVARRPFFAAVLAKSFPDDSATPQTEVDLIDAWWDRAGHDAIETVIPQRQRALIDLAQRGVRNLGKKVRTRDLKESTVAQLAGLKSDLIIRTGDRGASYSFAHDIFFEWVFFRNLIELDEDWSSGLVDAGEPPLLGRVVGLLAQNALNTKGLWSARYRQLEGLPLRPQWKREWLTAPPFTSSFANAHEEFRSLLFENGHHLLEKLLVWFQAQHTIPNPIVLQNPGASSDGLGIIGAAEYLGWPSDLESWGRLLDWLFPLIESIPNGLLSIVAELFSVWQNILGDIKNPRSSRIIRLCNDWLIGLEEDKDGKSNLGSAIRTIIMRSARSYPDFAASLFQRAVESRRMREKVFSELMAFTPTMVDASPSSIIDVVKAELIEELPLDRLDRLAREEKKRIDDFKLLRSIPEHERTEAQKRALTYPYMPSRSESLDFEDIGINRQVSFYFPQSALHEPYKSLFSKRPEIARKLISDLANHATEGWRQVQDLNRERVGTPVPIVVDFPWGRQEFWGDWSVYCWSMGQAPAPLECAFLALSYWAFKEIDAGRPTDEVIRDVLEGQKCYAALGIALALALEDFRVSDIVLPIVTCQRIWLHDMARVAQGSTRDIDIFGIAHLTQLHGEKAVAKEFLKSRKYHAREIRELAMRFALADDETLRSRFRDSLETFPGNLPFEREEQRTDISTIEALLEDARRWAGLGNIANYRQYQTDPSQLVIGYEPPKPLTESQVKRLEDSTSSLQEYSVIAWASKSLNAFSVAEGWSLEKAVAFAKSRDTPSIFSMRRSAGEQPTQTPISAVAAVVIRLGAPELELGWAWDVMRRVESMTEPADLIPGSKLLWHPTKHLIHALFDDRRSGNPRANTVERLIKLTGHGFEEVVELAFSALFQDREPKVCWVSVQLAFDLAVRERVKIARDGSRDGSALDIQKQVCIVGALGRLADTEPTSVRTLPSPWTTVSPSATRGGPILREATPFFDWKFAAHVLSSAPIELFGDSPIYRPLLEGAIVQLVDWTAERLMPTDDDRRNRDGGTLMEWTGTLGDILARAAPLFELATVRGRFLAPFLTDDDEGLSVLSHFADRTVLRHVLDAPSIPGNTLDLLMDCVNRTVGCRVFDPASYRAGQVGGYDLPRLTKALLFVPIEKAAPGSTRFANGDWSQITTVMPLVDRLVASVGWSTFVAETFLTLCERAGSAYPLDSFASQASNMLRSDVFKRGLTGTLIPARIAATVQRLADANYPLEQAKAQNLLLVLDALVDLGDRRSAALEQTEAFRRVQTIP